MSGVSVKAGLSQVKHIIAIGSGKGGVGKSTITINLARALRARGYDVGILDADLYGPSQPGMLGKKDRPYGQDGAIIPPEMEGVKFISMGVMNEEGSPVVMRSPLVIRALQQFLGNVVWGDLDFLLIDLPPGTGDIQLTIAQQTRLSGAVVVTTPQRVAADIAKLGLKMFESVHVPILGLVENMSGYECGECHHVNHIFSRGGGRKLSQELSVPFLGEVPLDHDVMLSSDEGLNLLTQRADSPGAKALEKVADEFLKQLEISETKMTTLEPKSMHIYKDNGELEITWKDGRAMIFQAMKLRQACPCAACVDEMTGKRTLDPKAIPVGIRLTAARGVGRYGLALTFSDSHSTGIYKFDYLQSLASAVGTPQEMSV